MRKDFCIRYIKHKQEVVKDIEKTQLEMAKSKGETITCQKGCHFCCVQFVDASIQDSEAIVYYLYENESVLNNFLQAYPTWREKVRNSGDSFKKMIRHWQKAEDTKWKDKETLQAGSPGIKILCMDFGYSDATTESGLSCLGKAEARAASSCQSSQWKGGSRGSTQQTVSSGICHG